MSKLKIFCGGGGGNWDNWIVRVTQDGHTSTDTGVNQYQLATAADNNHCVSFSLWWAGSCGLFGGTM